jgi:hypothetical protein
MRLRLLTLSAALLAASCGRDEVISIGQSIHHDHFEYSVQSVDRKDRIGNLHAKGLFYVVTFQVRNGAKTGRTQLVERYRLCDRSAATSVPRS